MKNKKTKIKLNLDDIKVQSFAIPVQKDMQKNLYGGSTITGACTSTCNPCLGLASHTNGTCCTAVSSCC